MDGSRGVQSGEIELIKTEHNRNRESGLDLTEGGFADFRFNPRLPEVEEFRQSVLNSDPYVQKYGVEGLV
ncbi:hypothetical protein IGI04_026071 [Brassica rapa subsp. trilocularis]|uniref:Uncharacterized protein n=1 Tax=Brassica rapa subsp. trilocularis TaxID=1813537 RepID=A0ABQ7KV90_BRACM|nr:hypothetical protein IGI04_026071 [Brassica rapa subsp. trilocularis]